MLIVNWTWGSKSGSNQQTLIYESHDGIVTKVSGSDPYASFSGGYSSGTASAAIVSILIEEI